MSLSTNSHEPSKIEIRILVFYVIISLNDRVLGGGGTSQTPFKIFESPDVVCAIGQHYLPPPITKNPIQNYADDCNYYHFV